MSRSNIDQDSIYKLALEDMAYQFAYRANGTDERPATMFTGGLSALEHAFNVLGWGNVKEAPDAECAVIGCHRWATCGTPKGTKNGQYLSCCGNHMAEAGLGATFDLKPDRIKDKSQ